MGAVQCPRCGLWKAAAHTPCCPEEDKTEKMLREVERLRGLLVEINDSWHRDSAALTASRAREAALLDVINLNKRRPPYTTSESVVQHPHYAEWGAQVDAGLAQDFDDWLLERALAATESTEGGT